MENDQVPGDGLSASFLEAGVCSGQEICFGEFGADEDVFPKVESYQIALFPIFGPLRVTPKLGTQLPRTMGVTC